MEKPSRPSKVELLKQASEHLRSPLVGELADAKPSMSEDAATILKFHGSYQQDDRDERTARKRAGEDKAYQFMVRLRLPGGRMTAAQYLTCAGLAKELGNGTLRITTRQSFQFHGILKQDLKPAIKRINESLLSTLAACGDVERNVLNCPAPLADGLREAMQSDAEALVAHFAPRTEAYWDIWLDGQKIENPQLPTPGPALVPTAGDGAVEPIYGPTYLPRKFKTAFALPEDNCVDVHANDLGFLADVQDGEIVGYNVLVGGGLGTTPSAAKTFPALAKPVAYVAREDYLRVAEAIVKVWRDHGNRSDRKRARIKYLIHDWGVPAFKAKVEEYLGQALADPRPIVVSEVCDHMGWHEQGDGRLWLGIPVENGRIRDDGPYRLFSGLQAFFARFGTPARLTCMQSILLSDIEPARQAEVEAWLEEFGIAAVEQVSMVRRWSIACPALPTCGLAVTESERVMPALLDEFERELNELGLAEERFTVRMTGCPNGCARPYNADIGLVGRSASKTEEGGNLAGTYTIFLGGSTLGERLGRVFKDYVPFDQIVAELHPLFERFQRERKPLERLGDFCDRVGIGSEATAAEYVEAAD